MLLNSLPVRSIIVHSEKPVSFTGASERREQWKNIY